MTRLKTEWIDYMLSGMDAYNESLREKCGLNLRELVQEVFLVSDEVYEKAVKETKVACIPVTQGEGVIGSFSRSVAAIVSSMGFKSWAEDKSDVDGIFSSYGKGANLIFMADDERYIGFNTQKNRISDNNYATALGFICVLRQMMKRRGLDIGKEKLLVVGLGIVGREACRILEDHNVDFDIYDIDEKAYLNLKSAGLDSEKYHKLKDKSRIKDYKYILDYTNVGYWLEAEDLAEDTLYASPGVPLSLTEEARTMLGNDAAYDNLEIGTAMMLGEALFG